MSKYLRVARLFRVLVVPSRDFYCGHLHQSGTGVGGGAYARAGNGYVCNWYRMGISKCDEDGKGDGIGRSLHTFF